MRKSLDLFDQKEELVVAKLTDAQLHYFPNAISTYDADNFLSVCLKELPWRQDTIRIAGKQIPVPRLQNWYGDAQAQYSYSGIRLKPLPWPDALLAIKRQVESISQHNFNSVLANYYRDGNDSVDWHSDDEPELGEQPVIASLSLGATRTFTLKHRYDKTIAQQKIQLHHGSLLVMSGHTQSHWLHRVAKEKHVDTARINLTFRQIKVNE